MSRTTPRSLCTVPEGRALARIFLHRVVKPTHDHRVPALRRPVLANLTRDEAADHGFDQRLFETARCLRMRNHCGSDFRQLPGRRVQPLEPRHGGGWGRYEQPILGGVRSYPPSAAPAEAISSTGNDMPVKQAVPDDC